MINVKKAKKTKGAVIVFLRQPKKKQRDDDVKFIKQVPLHPRERLRKEMKKQNIQETG